MKLEKKTQEHFKNKSLKTHYFKDFSRTTYNSITIQGIQGIQEPLATLEIQICNMYKCVEEELMFEPVSSNLIVLTVEFSQ